MHPPASLLVFKFCPKQLGTKLIVECDTVTVVWAILTVERDSVTCGCDTVKAGRDTMEICCASVIVICDTVTVVLTILQSDVTP